MKSKMVNTTGQTFNTRSNEIIIFPQIVEMGLNPNCTLIVIGWSLTKSLDQDGPRWHTTQHKKKNFFVDTVNSVEPK